MQLIQKSVQKYYSTDHEWDEKEAVKLKNHRASTNYMKITFEN